MNDTSSFAPSVSGPTFTYTDPISSFFGGIFFIIVFFLVIVFVVILLVGRALGLTSDATIPATTMPTTEAKKETFKNGPPYPHCQTNGAYAMF